MMWTCIFYLFYSLTEGTKAPLIWKDLLRSCFYFSHFSQFHKYLKLFHFYQSLHLICKEFPSQMRCRQSPHIFSDLQGNNSKSIFFYLKLLFLTMMINFPTFNKFLGYIQCKVQQKGGHSFTST